MKKMLLKKIKQMSKNIPTAIKTMAKDEIKYHAALLPIKAKLTVQNKIQQSVDQSVAETKEQTQKFIYDLKKELYQPQSFQPLENNTYFEQYYQQQRQRYTFSPQSNLAEQFHKIELSRKRY